MKSDPYFILVDPLAMVVMMGIFSALNVFKDALVYG